MDPVQKAKLQTLEIAQYQLSDIVDALEAKGAFTERMLTLAQNLQTEFEWEMMLIEEWS